MPNYAGHMPSAHRIYVNVTPAIKKAVAVRMKQLRQRSESDYVLLLIEDDFAKAGIVAVSSPSLEEVAKGRRLRSSSQEPEQVSGGARRGADIPKADLRRGG